MADETNKTEARDVHGPIATLDELRQLVGAIPSPFCQDPFAKCKIQDESLDYVAVFTGYDSAKWHVDDVLLGFGMPTEFKAKVTGTSLPVETYGYIVCKTSETGKTIEPDENHSERLDKIREFVEESKGTFEWDISESVLAEKKVNFKTGFTDAFQTKLPGGRVVTRQMLNTLGNIGTQCQFFEQCGGFYTFDRRVSDAIGGYPNNALLQFFDKETNALRTVVSLKDDNTADFVSDRSLIDGEHWKFVDDNPEIGIDVDYSDFIDLSDRIFTSTGITDLYEVPYDSYLQMFAVCTLDCESMARNQTEDLEIETGFKTETKTEIDPKTGEEIEVEITTPTYAEFNGMYATNAYGTAYLDVHNKEGTSFGSVIIGGYNPFLWFVHANNKAEGHEEEAVNHIVETCPLSPLSCGIVLSKGDKIRIRNNVVSKMNNDAIIRRFGENAVHDYFFDDKTLKKNYYFKFANLYRRRCTV